MPVEPITHLEKSIAGEVEPVTHLEQVISEYGGGGGGGGAVSSVNGKTGAVVLTASDVGAAPAETVVEVSGTTPTIAAADNTKYECGELTSLTVSSVPNPGKFWIWFTSGATATTVTGIDNFTPEANKTYKITVENGYATFDSWTVGGGT